MNGFSTDRRGLLWTLGGLQYDEEALIEEPDAAVELPELEAREALAWDYELLGLSPGDHPMRMLRAKLKTKGIISAAEMAKLPAGRMVSIAGLVVVRQAPPTANGHLFITLEDETGLANLIIRPDLYQKQRNLLHSATFLTVQGMMQRDGRATSVLVREVKGIEG